MRVFRTLFELICPIALKMIFCASWSVLAVVTMELRGPKINWCFLRDI